MCEKDKKFTCRLVSVEGQAQSISKDVEGVVNGMKSGEEVNFYINGRYMGRLAKEDGFPKPGNSRMSLSVVVHMVRGDFKREDVTEHFPSPVRLSYE